MRKVATIPIDQPADLVQATYARAHDQPGQHLDLGARAAASTSCVDPDGTTYVMQSYSLMRDPLLRIGDLRSLGARLVAARGLALPDP